ncbi:MAG: endonuclease/exonuclease/phosphatase family protein [Vampirovibrionales bacterium]|nr:endonuclease/exonuclease/phosphatase family protein [Vampirovibrionales bacterium]
MLSILRAIVGYPFHLLKGLLQALAVVLLVASTVSLVGGYLGEGIGPNHEWAEVFDLLSHLRMVSLLGQLISIGIFLLIRDIPWGIAAFIVLGVNLSQIVPYYLPQPKPFNAEAASLKLLHWNVYKDNRNEKGIIQYIQEKQPDIIALQEVDQQWLTAMNVPLRNYAYRVLVPQDNNFGVALYSKLPILSKQVRSFDEAPPPPPSSGVEINSLEIKNLNDLKKIDLKQIDPKKVANSLATSANQLFRQVFPRTQFPSIIATVRYRNNPLTLIVTHPVPPISGFDAFKTRNKQLKEAAIFAGRLHQPVILMGDLNCSPWSVYYKALLKNSGLKDSQIGFGIQPSWPNWVDGPGNGLLNKRLPQILSPFFQIPIDHILVSPQFVVLKRELGPVDTRSDHLPVFAELAIDTTSTPTQ